MDPLELFIVVLYNSIIAIFACSALGLATKTQKALKPWLLVYISFALANFFLFIRFFIPFFYYLSQVFFAVTVIFLFSVVTKEYIKLFVNSNRIETIVKNSMLGVTVIPPLIIGIQFFMAIFVSISIFMLLRIYLNTRSVTKLFFLLSTNSALLSVLMNILFSYGIEGTSFLSYLFNAFFSTLMLSSGFIALLEKKFKDTLEEKNSLKDKYSHDLGNILHVISMTYDLFNIDYTLESKQEEPNENTELDDLIKVKINEASKLVRDIRDL